jgi:hypothetical protein
MPARLVPRLAILILLLLAPGCASVDWMPRYLEAKVRIDTRYRNQMTSLRMQRIRGQISSSYYDRRSRALEAQWDRELTAAKARAQGRSTSSHRSSSGRSSSSRGRSSSSHSNDTDDAGSSPSGSGPSNDDENIRVPLDSGGELRGRSSGGGGRLD